MIKSPMRGETPKRGLCVIAVTIPINVGARKAVARPIKPYNPCLLYTSDAADDP